ncbi:MAG: hypothetical protein HZB26_23810 [Candidatus Hydrogenedentes bacterium]|nr:hypothetical protein [Candidatus Hydrogenedentota bacterium]
MVKAKLKNPKVKVGDTVVTFPVEIESGAYLEYNSMTDCKLYGPNGALVAEVKPEGAAPGLNPGDNKVEFTCEPPAGVSARAHVTVIGQGEPIK